VSGPVSPEDKRFLRQFSLVMALLALLALVLIAIAAIAYDTEPQPPDPALQQRADARIAPVGAVYSGVAGEKAIAAAQAEAAKAAASEVAYGGTLDGHVIFNHLCQACHAKGIAGAPIIGNKAMWDPRIAQGINVLIQHAIHGYHGPDGNFMPPKGGNPALSDAQIAATVKWMVAQAQK